MARTSDPRPAGWWRVATPVAVGLCGALFVVSAVNSDGADLRPGRYTDLASLVSTESRQLTDLKSRVAQLTAEVDALATGVDTREVRRLRREAEALEAPAGLAPVTGAGLTITLSDAPEDVINSSTQDLNLLVVHQQDIQAVVNALWKGGAAGVTVQGQRLVTTTGIKCEGNAVQLDGVPYPQPYVIEGVGDQAALLAAIEEDSALRTYRAQAQQPDIAVGWQLQTQPVLTLPAYSGLTDLRYAQVSAE
jgi:uncharacterized protein YlxW (UPF0749 family)